MHINYFKFEKKTRKKNRMQKKKEENRMQQFPFQEKTQLHVEFIKTPRNLGCVYINKNHEMGVGVTDKMMTTI